MKKVILAALIIGGACASAVEISTSSTSTTDPKQSIPLNASLMVGKDSSGNIVPMAVASGGGFAGSATITGNVTIGGYIPLTSNSYAVVNNVVTAINVTGTATGLVKGKPVTVTISPNAKIAYSQADSGTVPVYLTGTVGCFISASATVGVSVNVGESVQLSVMV